MAIIIHRVQKCYPSYLMLLPVWGLIAVNLCGIANARTTGSALLSYDLIEEDGKWSGESEQRIDLSMRGRTGSEESFGLNLGILRSDNKLTFLGGLAPMYALNLRSRHYSLTSGYSVRVHRDIVSSRIYENLGLFLPSLPAFRLTYTKQGTRDTQKEHRINSTGSNMQFTIEDEVGPFLITLNRRAYTLRDLVRGPLYDTESSDTSGNVDFTYLYRQLFSLNGRYGIGQLRTKRGLTGETKGKDQDFHLDFRISPVPTIALSGTTAGRRQQSEGSAIQAPLPTPRHDSLINRLQLMLQPLEGILLNASYSISDTSRDKARPLSSETRSLTVNVEPWRNLALSGHFVLYDSQESRKRLSTQRRDSLDLRAEPIEGLRILSRLDLLESTNLVSGLRSHRNSVVTKVEAMLTRNLRTDIGYDWQKFGRGLRDEITEEIQHRLILATNYSFARMLDISFRFGKDISDIWKGSTDFLACGLSCSINESSVTLRYDRASSPARSSSLPWEEQWTTRIFTAEFDQEFGRDTRLSLSYESRLGRREFSYRGTKRISFRVNTKF